MRVSVAALALIRRQRGGRPEWLAQWNTRWQRYNFVGGHREPPESWRACVVREIKEELGLRPGREVRIGRHRHCRLSYRAWSEGSQQETCYRIDLFDVRLRRNSARRKIAGDSQNRWLSEVEIRSGRTQDGQPVSETMLRVLVSSGLLPDLGLPV